MRTSPGAAARGALLAFLIAATPAPAASPPRLKLVAADGSALAAARVTLLGPNRSAVTDRDGFVRLEPLPTPPFDLAVSSADGIRLGLVRVDAIASDEPTVVRLPAIARADVTVTSGASPSTLVPPAAAATNYPATARAQQLPQRLADTLAEVPGSGRLEEGQSVVPSLRGFARGRTLLLLDDGRISAERRAGPSGTFLDPFSFQDVEVVRGPGSLAYGSDAFGGVIHVRTPMPDASGLSGRAEFTAGVGQPLATGGVEVNAPVGRGAVLVQARQRWFGDYDAPARRIDNSAARDRGLLARWTAPLEGGTRVYAGVELDEGVSIGKPALDSGVTRAFYPKEESNRFSLGVDLPGALGFSSVEIRAFAGGYRLLTYRDRLATPAQARRLSEADVTARDASLRATGTRALGRGTLRTGVDVNGRFGLRAIGKYYDYAADGTTATALTLETSVEAARRWDFGAFADVAWPLVPGRLDAAGGLRVDAVSSRNAGGYYGDRSTSTGALSGYAALTATIVPGLTGTLQAARGFRDPLLSDRYFRGVSGRGFVTGNPDLGAETANQLDLAVRYTTGPVRVAGYGFVYRVRDVIERYQTGTDFFFRNRGQLEVTGAELEVDADLGRAFVVRVNAGLTRGEIRDDGSAAADVPPASFGVSVEHRPGRGLWWRARLAAYAADSRPGPTEKATPGYAVVDLGGGWTPIEFLDIRVAARNLLDKSYPATPDAVAVDAPGRNVTGVLAMRF